MFHGMFQIYSAWCGKSCWCLVWVPSLGWSPISNRWERWLLTAQNHTLSWTIVLLLTVHPPTMGRQLSMTGYYMVQKASILASRGQGAAL